MTLTTSSTATNATVAAADLVHVPRLWSAQSTLAPLAIAGGSGSTVWEHDGNRYLDFSVTP
ncbi:hypothetical protein ACI3KX_04280 [Microbacterium sp. ZW CA_36]|uniref:hypothetical protein n=1 Tax=Microbacterium sp. ZW CA_36 TaxID=3378078 RepID=UPI003853BBE9